jgi:hypothetical protein
VRRIAMSGLVALAAVLGGAAVPATALAQPATALAQPATALAQPATALAQPATAVRSAATVRPGVTARPAAVGGVVAVGEPTVSCLTATDCVAVEGSSVNGAGSATPTRVARWNGSSWKRLGVTLPKGTRADDLLGVSCKGVKSCLVVGDYYTSTSESALSHVLALSYNGTSLKPTAAVPLPKGTTDAELTGLSCATTRYCVALGAAGGDTAAFGTSGSLIIIETWNGARWTLHTAAASIGKTMVGPSVVSCATPAFCVLTGVTYSSATLTSSALTSGTTPLYLASWNGKRLTTMKPAPVSSPAGSVLLPTGVSCAVTGTDLGPIDSSTDKSTAFTEIWNGKAWQLAKVAWPKSLVYTFTLGVSCYAAHSCEAVGEDGASAAQTSPFDAVGVSLNGTAGTVQVVPAPPKGDSNAFASVSCLSGGRCVAIGETGKATANSGALMTGVWNGKTWKLDPGF